jgi:hypothetical protein
VVVVGATVVVVVVECGIEVDDDETVPVLDEAAVVVVVVVTEAVLVVAEEDVAIVVEEAEWGLPVLPPICSPGMPDGGSVTFELPAPALVVGAPWNVSSPKTKPHTANTTAIPTMVAG